MSFKNGREPRDGHQIKGLSMYNTTLRFHTVPQVYSVNRILVSRNMDLSERKGQGQPVVSEPKPLKSPGLAAQER